MICVEEMCWRKNKCHGGTRSDGLITNVDVVKSKGGFATKMLAGGV
jgi:hypothetical protein